MLYLETRPNLMVQLEKFQISLPWLQIKKNSNKKTCLHEYSILSYFYTHYLLPYSYTVELLPTGIKTRVQS